MREYLFELLEAGGELSLETVLLRLAASAVIGCFIFLSYRFPTAAAFTAPSSM